jgi:hypothetical protein
LTDPLLDDLGRADLVKFARRMPSRAECDGSMHAGRHLVLATRLVPEVEATRESQPPEAPAAPAAAPAAPASSAEEAGP